MAGVEDLVVACQAMGVDEQSVLDAVRAVPRTAYVPSRSARHAYIDEPVPIPHRQVTSQPSLCARMVQALKLSGSSTVLEIGTGYGYQTALLARLVEHVVTVERWPRLVDSAHANLNGQGVTNVTVVLGDGTEGVPEHAPYDGIVVSAAFPQVPIPLVEQLREGGRVVQPIGPGGTEEVTCFQGTPSGLVLRERLVLASFVRLQGRHAYHDL